MIRRRRPPREVAFSFDSFLDVVANVVGIILRLIIVAWVGARAYKAAPAPPPPAPPLPEHTAYPEPDAGPLADEARRQRELLAAAHADLAEQMRAWRLSHDEGDAAAAGLADLDARRRALDAAAADLDRAAAGHGQSAQTAALSLDELRERGRRLAEEVAALKAAPSRKHALRFRTPLSAPVQTEELLFECKNGRVTLVDVGALLDEARRGLQGQGDRLKTAWEVTDTTAPAGAFRLRYTVERVRDVPGVAGEPDARASFHFGIAGWEAVPVQEPRGEDADAALRAGSAFRRVIDALDTQQTAVTFWVYPDSFAAYRRLRDHLHERDVVVAGRPLPDGVPIASSKRGTASRGQ